MSSWAETWAVNPSEWFKLQVGNMHHVIVWEFGGFVLTVHRASGHLQVEQLVSQHSGVIYSQTWAQNSDIWWLVEWKPPVTLVLFLSLNHRKRSHTRATTAQRRLHVSASESNHIRAVSKPQSNASLLIIFGFLFCHRTWLTAVA